MTWAGSDSDQRPPPRQGGILTRLDHRPSDILIVILYNLNIKFVFGQ
jgi:hypothetical protein